MYQVAIKNNETGEIRLCNINLEWLEHSDFWWTEGNMACDCNRSQEFARAGNESDPNVDCNVDENKYSVLYALLTDGKKINLENNED